VADSAILAHPEGKAAAVPELRRALGQAGAPPGYRRVPWLSVAQASLSGVTLSKSV
jgi:hypothetical protein